MGWGRLTMTTPQPYDAIAARYRDSKQLPFRHVVERYTLFQLLGDLRGLTVVDFGCGEGIHARRFMRAGAAAVTGVDNSTEMIALAEAAERADPLGCRYVCADAAEFVPATPVDVVTAVYLLNYARTPDEMAAFCRACFGSLRSGGRLVGFNDNVRCPLPGKSLAMYGFERTCRHPPAEGDVVRYRITNPDGGVFEIDNYYLPPAAYEAAMRDAGFQDFHWIDVSLDPSEPQRCCPPREISGFFTNPPEGVG